MFTEQLQLRRVSAKFVPRLFTDDQKENSYLAKRQTSVVPHPPYFPDLTPTDFFLFPQVKPALKGRRFQTVGEIKENAIRELRAITESAFQEAFQQWKEVGNGVSLVEGTTL
jgi:hypothetical protein